MPEPFNYLGAMQGEKSILPALGLGVNMGLQFPTALENEQKRSQIEQGRAQTANIQQATEKGIAVLPLELKQLEGQIGLQGEQVRGARLLNEARTQEVEQGGFETERKRILHDAFSGLLTAQTPEEMEDFVKTINAYDPEGAAKREKLKGMQSEAQRNSKFNTILKLAAAADLTGESSPDVFENTKKSLIAAAKERGDREQIEQIDWIANNISELGADQAKRLLMAEFVGDPERKDALNYLLSGEFGGSATPQTKLFSGTVQMSNQAAQEAGMASDLANNISSLRSNLAALNKAGNYKGGALPAMKSWLVAQGMKEGDAETQARQGLKQVLVGKLVDSTKNLKGAISNKEFTTLQQALISGKEDYASQAQWLEKFEETLKKASKTKQLESSWLMRYGSLGAKSDGKQEVLSGVPIKKGERIEFSEARERLLGRPLEKETPAKPELPTGEGGQTQRSPLIPEGSEWIDLGGGMKAKRK